MAEEDKIDNFPAFFSSKLQPELEKLEQRRQAIKRNLVLFVAFQVLAFIGMLYLVAFVLEEWVYMPLLLLAALLVGGLSYFGFQRFLAQSLFYSRYKKMIGQIIHYIEPQLQFDNNKRISKADYLHSRIFPKAEVEYQGDDRVSGMVNGAVVEFSELQVKYKRKEDRLRYNQNYQFRGIFFVIDYAQSFPVDLIISPKEKAVLEGELVATDHGSFNREFTIKCIGEYKRQAADHLLDKDMLDRILNFSKQFPNPVYLSLRENSLYVAIEHQEDLFEPAIWKESLDYAHTYKHFLNLYHPISIINRFSSDKMGLQS